jgi:hypothetical protein
MGLYFQSVIVLSFLASCKIEKKQNSINERSQDSKTPSVANVTIADPVPRNCKLKNAPMMGRSVHGGNFGPKNSELVERERELKIRRMAEIDPEQTLEKLISGEIGFEKFWIEVAMAEFLSKDSDKAIAWYQTKAADLEIEENDRVLLALARFNLGQGGWRKALKFKDLVVNPEVKKAIGDDIGTTINQSLRESVRKSPESTMNDLSWPPKFGH